MFPVLWTFGTQCLSSYKAYIYIKKKKNWLCWYIQNTFLTSCTLVRTFPLHLLSQRVLSGKGTKANHVVIAYAKHDWLRRGLDPYIHIYQTKQYRFKPAIKVSVTKWSHHRMLWHFWCNCSYRGQNDCIRV